MALELTLVLLGNAFYVLGMWSTWHHHQQLRARVQTLEGLTTQIPWPCAYCSGENHTAAVLWDTVKYSLICRDCRSLQDYPNYIRQFDPRPPLVIWRFDRSAPPVVVDPFPVSSRPPFGG